MLILSKHFSSANCFCLYLFIFIRSWCDGSSDRSFMVDPLNYFSFQPALHDWCNKGCWYVLSCLWDNLEARCSSLVEHLLMVGWVIGSILHAGPIKLHKEPLLLIGKSSPCGRDNRYLLSLSEWSFTIFPMHISVKCVECVIKYNISFIGRSDYHQIHMYKMG